MISLDPISPYLKYVKIGSIVLLILCVVLYIQSLKHDNLELELKLAQSKELFANYQVEAQSREITLHQVITTQQESITKANAAYSSINKTLGAMIKQNNTILIDRNIAFDKKQTELKNATIPSNCEDALKFMATYPSNTWGK